MVWLILTSFFILVVMTFYNWSTNKNILFLALHLASISIYALSHYFLAIDFNAVFGAILFNHFTPLYLASGPLLYLYIRGVLEDKFEIQGLDWLHFVPALLQLALVMPYTLGYAFDEKVQLMQELYNNPNLYLETIFNWPLNGAYSAIIRFISFMSYLVFSAVKVYQFIDSNRERTSNNLPRLIVSRWLSYLLFSLVSMSVLYAYFLLNQNNDLNYVFSPESVVLQTVIALFIIFNNFSLLVFPEIMFGIIVARPIRSTAKRRKITGSKSRQVAKIPIKDLDYFENLSGEIENLMKRANCS